MGHRFSSFLLSLFLVFAIAFGAHAEPGLHPLSHFELQQGVPLFQQMKAIAAKMDREARRMVTIVDYDTIQEMREKFEPEVFEKLMPLFKNGEDGFMDLCDELEGKKVNVMTVVPEIARILEKHNLLKDKKKIGLAATRLAPAIMLSSGAGTEIDLGFNIRTFHYGFKPGDDSGNEDPKKNRGRTKGGRSFGEGGGRGYIDPSDVYYLKELARLVARLKDPYQFYEVVYAILTKGDTSGVANLPKSAQTVLADWFTIYIAEQRRFFMTGQKKMDWQNALTELTILAMFVDKAHLIINTDGEIIEGKLEDFFAVGHDGSGLGGLAGIKRREFTKMISNIMAELTPDQHRALKRLIRVHSGTDLICGQMKWLNNRKNQKEVQAKADAFSEAAVNFLRAMRDNAEDIANELRP